MSPHSEQSDNIQTGENITFCSNSIGDWLLGTLRNFCFNIKHLRDLIFSMNSMTGQVGALIFLIRLYHNEMATWDTPDTQSRGISNIFKVFSSRASSNLI